MTKRSRERRLIAADFLMRVRDDLERVERTRAAYADAAHKQGMSWADVGSWLGVTADEAELIAEGA